MTNSWINENGRCGQLSIVLVFGFWAAYHVKSAEQSDGRSDSRTKEFRVYGYSCRLTLYTEAKTTIISSVSEQCQSVVISVAICQRRDNETNRP